MRRIIFPAILAITFTSGLASAQAAAPNAAHHGKRHGHNPHAEAMKMSQRLNLSSDQTAKLEPILANRDQKIAALRGNTVIPQQDMKAQMRSIHKETRQQLNTVLTPEQLQQMKSMRRGRGAPQQGTSSTVAPSAYLVTMRKGPHFGRGSLVLLEVNRLEFETGIVDGEANVAVGF